MAGDWIKMSTSLGTNPKVVRIASALKADGRPDRLRVIGALHAVWCLFDVHSESGALSGYTLAVIDDLIGWPGFAKAMAAVEWLEIDANDNAVLPRYETHNGASAKRRAMEADRKREVRARPVSVPVPSASDADKKRTRIEKNRGEVKSTVRSSPARPPVDNFVDSFTRFWSAWPASPRKRNRKGCEVRWKSRKLDALVDRIVANIEARKLTDEWKRGFEPLPLTYLNQDQWEDEIVDRPQGEGVKEWHETASGITGKGKELGVIQAEGEHFQTFKRRVHEAAGFVPNR